MFKFIYDGSAETRAHKDVFAAALAEIAEKDPAVIYLDADLMNSSGTYKYWKEHPERAIECGISEANMIGVAGGLSAVGRKPYCHSFGPFASRRCFDQIFISVGYAKNSVRIFGSDPGVCAAFNGGTHMPFEDMALLRAVPGAMVMDIADGVQLDWVVRAIKDREGVTYFRSTRKTYRKIYAEGSDFTLGKGNLLRDGSDATIVACGLMVGEALEAAEILATRGLSIRVVDMFTVKPIDAELLVRCARETGVILTTENHNVIGGLGDASGAALLEAGVPCVFHKHGVDDRFGQVGPVDYLQKVYGLTAERLVLEMEALLTKKSGR